MFNPYASSTGFNRASQKAISAGLALSSSVSLAAPAAMANGAVPTFQMPVTPRLSPQIVSGAGSAFGSLSVKHQPPGSTSAVAGSGAWTSSLSTKQKAQLSNSTANGSGQSSANGVLNFGSSAMNFLAGNLAGLQNLTIDVGGRQEVVNLNTKLTGAELVAAEQELTTGTQSLTLSSSGQATGGSVILNGAMLSAIDSALGGSISSLTVSRGVALVDSVSNLSLSGSLTNYGSILTAGGTSGGTDKISASSILNAAGGSIGSYTGSAASGNGSGTSPGSSLGSSSGNGGGSNTLYAADPSLSAATAITNSGSISSSGNLYLTAPVVTNAAVSGSLSAASMTAVHNININTQTLNNSGQIESSGGNVNVASSGALTVNGTGGTIQASSGNINLSSTNADITVTGGNMLSQQLNFNAGTGNIATNMGEVSGVVNATGNQIHIGADTQDLQMGTINASGDPLVTNAADITIDTSSTFTTLGEPLTLVAGQNIDSAAGGILSTSSVSGTGGSLTLIAGAAFTSTTGGGIKVTGANAGGGNIDLTGISNITTNSTAPKAAAGGAVEMIAFAQGGTGGQINIPSNITVNASGSLTGAAGNITIIAGATTGNAISTGPLDGKTVTVITATPVVPTGGISFASTGVQSGTVTTPTLSINAATTSIGNVTGTLDVTSNGTATVTNSTGPLTLGTIAMGSAGTFTAINNGSGSNGNITVSGTEVGNNISITGTGTVDVTKTITGSGTTSAIVIDGGAASTTSNAVIIGANVIADKINIGLGAGNLGTIELTDSVGSATTTTTATVAAGSGVTGGDITGSGTVSAATVTLGAAISIGTAAKPIETDATTLLMINPITQNSEGAFVAQKTNVSLGNSNSADLVLKVTGNLDVTGTINAPAQSLTSTGSTTVGSMTVAGTITNAGTGTPGTILITAGKNFILDPNGTFSALGDTQPVTINVTGTGTINGTISVQTLNLKTSEALTIGTSTPGQGMLTDGTDNISAKGIVTVNGQITDSTLNLTSTTSLTIALGSVITASSAIGSNSNITAETITNNSTSVTGNITYTATGSKDSFINNGTINGESVTINTSSASGILENTGTGLIEATLQNSTTDVPTLNLISRDVDNLGTVEAAGLTKDTNGVLNITSPTTLIVTGPATGGGFVTMFSSAVNLKADGNITIGSTTENPFSAFNSGLGSFSVNTTGIFTSPLQGIAVSTNSSGTVGGTINITAGSLAFNGTGTAGALSLSSTALGTTAVSPVTVDITGSKGLTVGSGAGDVTVTTIGFGPSNVVDLSTSQSLVLKTGLTTFNSSGTSLMLTGTKGVLVNGDLKLGQAVGTDLTITSTSSSAFFIGGATTNGQSGINQSGNSGQGMEAYLITLNLSSAIVELQQGTGSLQGATLNGLNGVNINAKGLTINQGADVVSTGATSTGLTLTATTGTLSYINTNGATNQPTNFVSLINLSDKAGTLTLGSGATGTAQTVLSVGNALDSGGTFNINAAGLSFGSGGIMFDATDGNFGGQVNINLTGSTSVKIGTGSGGIGANLFTDTANSGGVFNLKTGGSITVTNLFNAGTPADSAIQFGTAGAGTLLLNADGSASKISISGINGIDINTLSLTSHSTSAFVMSDTTTGNGILDGTTGTPAVITAANLTVVNSGGGITTNGVNLTSVSNALQELTLTSSGTLNTSLNPSYAVSANILGAGGQISLSASNLVLSGTGLSLTAQGGQSTGSSISVVSTSTAAPVGIGMGANLISFDVSSTQNNIGGSISVTSGNSLTVDGSAIKFGSNPAANIGASLSLTSGFGSNLLLNNASSLVGLNFGTVNLTSGGTTPFLLDGATANGNGIASVVGPNTLVAGTINIKALGGSEINTQFQAFEFNSLTLTTTGTVNLVSTTPITASPDSLTVGTGANSGNGGSITINAGTLAGEDISFSALGSGAVGTIGGSITINATTTNSGLITIGTAGPTFGFYFNVSDNGGKAAGSISITNSNNDIAASLAGLTYGTAGGGSLTLSGNNLLISNVSSLPLSPLSSVTLTSNSSSTFLFGSANTNGFADASMPTLTATNISISNTGGPLNTQGGVAISANSITLATSGMLTFGAPTITATPLNGTGGTIKITAGSVALGEGVLLNAFDASGGGGTVLVTVTGSGLAIGSTLLSVDVSNQSGKAGGTVTISSGTDLTADLSALTMGTAGNLTLSSSGNLLISNVTSPTGLNTLSLDSASSQTFVLGGASSSGGNGIEDNSQAISAANITITNSAGSITNGTLTSLTGTSAINLNAVTNIGASGAPINIASTPSLSLISGGNTYVNTTGTTTIASALVVGSLTVTASAGNLTVGGASPSDFSVGSLSITYSNANAANANTLSLNNVSTTNGDIAVSSNAENLIVNTNASLSTINGNISLQNTDTSNASLQILVESGVNIHASGSASDPNQGNVYIVVGPLPPAFTPLPGTSAGTSTLTTGGGAITFGAAVSNPNGSIDALGGDLDLLQALGRNIVFNTFGPPFGSAAITLDTNVTITADPPAPTAPTQGAIIAASAAPGPAAQTSSQPLSSTASTWAEVQSSSSLSAPFTVSAVGPSSSLFASGNSSGTISGITNASVTSAGITNTGITNAGITSAGIANTGITNAGISSAGIANTGITSAGISSAGIANSAVTNAGITNTDFSAAKQTVTAQGGNGHNSSFATSCVLAPKRQSGSPLPNRLSGEVSNASHRSLDRGAILLSPQQDTVIDTKFGQAKIAAGSVTLIISTNDCLAIYNLHDGHKNAVTLADENKTICVLPGRAVVKAKSTLQSFERANPAPFVAYRRLSCGQNDGYHSLYQADFDMASMLHGLPGVKDLIASRDARQRRIANNLLKTAAILMQISQSAEPYKIYVTPALTASALAAAR